jgi:DNA processing protein
MIPIKVNILKQNDPCYPQVLKDISGPPKQLFWTGSNPSEWLDRPRVAVVGSRKASAYGREVTTRLTSELARAGVVIISGLALGIDSVAHKGALEAGGITVAVLPTPLQQIYPVGHLNLARQISSQKGTLLSEYAKGAEVYRNNFIERNRIVSGLADILLITEAAVNSGSLHTARFALDQGKTVMVVPGNITSLESEGCNNLIKSGALPVTQVGDIFFELKLNPEKLVSRMFNGSEEEQAVLTLIQQGITEQEELTMVTKLGAAKISQILTVLEINGYIRPQGGGNWLAI